MQRYRLQRRLIGQVYQPANVRKHEDAIDRVLDKLVPQIRSLQGQPVELKEWMHIVAVECLGAVVLGWSPGYLRDRTDWSSSIVSYLSWRQRSIFGLFPLATYAQFLSFNLGRRFETIWGIRHDSTALKGFKSFFPVSCIPRLLSLLTCSGRGQTSKAKAD